MTNCNNINFYTDNTDMNYLLPVPLFFKYVSDKKRTFFAFVYRKKEYKFYFYTLQTRNTILEHLFPASDNAIFHVILCVYPTFCRDKE